MKLILLPGLEGTGILFGPLLQHLPDPMAIEIIGYPATGIEQSYEQLSDYIKETLPQDEDFILVAESFAGPIAYRLAQENIPRLKGIAFVVTFLKVPVAYAEWLGTYVPPKWLMKLGIPDAMLKYWLLGDYATKPLMALLKQAIKQAGLEAIFQRLMAVSRLNLSLNKVAVPCCYIGATEDRLVPAENIIAFRENCDRLREYWLPGPHMILQTQPEQCAKLIDGFIKEITGK